MRPLFYLLFCTALSLSTYNLEAQTFEGKITIKSEVLDLPAEQQAYKSMMESTIVTYVKGDKAKTETQNPVMGNMYVITDRTKKEVITCMDMMGSKTAIVSSMDEYSEQATQKGYSKPTFKDTGESKTVAGYKCYKNICTMSSPETGEMTMDIWYTKDIPNANMEYSELPGLPLEYSISVMGMKMHFIATEISKEKVDDSQFTIPAEFKRMTQEEFMQSMGGGKQ